MDDLPCVQFDRRHSGEGRLKTRVLFEYVALDRARRRSARVLRSGDALECRADICSIFHHSSRLFLLFCDRCGRTTDRVGSMQMATPCSSWITHEVSLVKINRAYRARVDRKDRILTLRTHRKGEQGAHSHLTPMKLANCQLTFARGVRVTKSRFRRLAVVDL